MKYFCDNPKCPFHIPLVLVDMWELKYGDGVDFGSHKLEGLMKQTGFDLGIKKSSPHHSGFVSNGSGPVIRITALSVDTDLSTHSYEHRTLYRHAIVAKHHDVSVVGHFCTQCHSAASLFLGQS